MQPTLVAPLPGLHSFSLTCLPLSHLFFFPTFLSLTLLLLLSGQCPNPGPRARAPAGGKPLVPQYPCAVCHREVRSGYLCRMRDHWVHMGCSGLRSTKQYRGDPSWACPTCSNPHPQLHPSSPPPPPTSPSSIHSITITKSPPQTQLQILSDLQQDGGKECPPLPVHPVSILLSPKVHQLWKRRGAITLALSFLLYLQS